MDPVEDFFKIEDTKDINNINDPPPALIINVTFTYGKAKIKFKRPKDFNNVMSFIIFSKHLIRKKELQWV